MSELDRYRGAIAQIFADQEATRTLGTGVTISNQGYVLTCWHVIRLQGTLLTQVYVRFAGQGRIRSAEVLQRHASEELDYVVLKVEGQAPEPIPFGSGKPTGRFFSFGYRKNELADGLAASGEMLTRTALTRKRVPRIQLKSADIEGGMSGAPVWSEADNQVVGLVSETYFPKSSKDTELAFAVPLDEIIKNEGELGSLVGLVFVQWEKPHNPFTQRGVIFDPQLFIGRQRDLEAVSHLIDRRQAVAIVGEAQSGKSSLLRRLYEKYKASVPSPTAFVDMNRITSEEHFFTWIGRSVGEPFTDAAQFDAWAVDEQGLLLFIDDYHCIMRPTMAVVQQYLRGLGQAPNKVMVVTSPLTMPYLFPAYEYGLSNPGTIFMDYLITPFSIVEAEELARAYLANTGVHFTDQELIQCLDKSRGSPYALQKEFESLFETKIR